MIEFKYRLPRMNVGEKQVGTYNNNESGLPGIFTTSDPKLGIFMQGLRNIVSMDRRLVFIDNKMIGCSINWIRDDVHQMKAFRHWDYSFRDFLDFIIDTQREDGQYYELIKQLDDEHWKFVNEDCYRIYEDDNLALTRLEIEADIEYLVVEGAMYCYKVFPDDEWLAKVLPKLEKGIDYMTSDSKRWDEEHGLVKRAFTIDTWDFAYKQSAVNRRIEESTPMSIMHGDNSGVYQAMLQLAWFNNRLGRKEQADKWEKRAEELRNNIFKHLWNGEYFIHQLHLGHEGADDKENVRLSLSCTYDINRGLTDVSQSRSIIEEYIKRRDKAGYFAEWFTIDPPYPENTWGFKPGDYVNGAVSPYTAGELAKAAFNNGYEEYAWDIIKRLMAMMDRDGSLYFLYYPDTQQPQGRGPSGWGAAAVLSAIDEGLAGIVDAGVNYDIIDFKPRFVVTEYNELRYLTGYEASSTPVDVRFIITDIGMRYDIISPSKEIRAHILLPKGRDCTTLLVDGVETKFELSQVGVSKYVDVNIKPTGKLSIELLF